MLHFQPTGEPPTPAPDASSAVNGVPAPDPTEALIDRYILEHGTWDALRARISSETDLDASVRDAAIRGVEILTRQLGSDWPSSAIRHNHPLIQALFFNQAPWTRTWIARFASDVERVAGLKDWKALRDRLRHATPDARAARMEIEWAAGALNRGYVVELGPVAQGSHRADLRVCGLGTTLVVEATQVRDLTREMARAAAIHEQAFPPVELLSSHMAHGGGFLRNPSDEEWVTLSGELHAFWESHLGSRTPGVFERPGLIRVWVSNETPREPSALNGPPAEINPVQRIADRIPPKSSQLRLSEAGLLLVQAPMELALLQLQRISPTKIARAIASQLLAFPPINVLVVVQQYFAADIECGVFDLGEDHLRIVSQPDEASYLDLLVVTNAARRFPEADSLVKSLVIPD